MANPKYNAPLLQDLALIYVALAQGADQQLDVAEQAVMLERLRSWSHLASDEVLHQAMHTALNTYMADTAGEQLQQAIAHIRETVSVKVRQALLEDLMDIALADAKFLYKESDFIGQLTQAWEVYAPDTASRRQWNVIRQRTEAGAWTPVHDLALLFLAVAHGPDTMLAHAEMQAICKKLEEWLPAATGDDVEQVVKEALRVYATGPEEDVVDRAILAVRQSLPPHQGAALLADLNYIAQADGVTLVEEKALIAQLAQALELPLDS